MGTLAAFTWMLFIPVAILNGLLRETLYKPIVGDLLAHQISTVIASVVFITVAYLMLRNEFESAENGILFMIGFMWVLMTMCFEFGFGLYVDGASWGRLVGDYNLFEGRIWVLFLVMVFFTPYIVKILYSRLR